MGFLASIPFLLQEAAGQITVDGENPWQNPFDDFLKVVEDIRHHYRSISEIDYKNTLLRKWVIDSLLACARVHYHLLLVPPAGAEPYLDDVSDTLIWLLSWTAKFFENQTQLPEHQAEEAARSIARLAMELMKANQDRPAKECGSVIARIVTHVGGSTRNRYVLANLQINLEILARAAVALAKSRLAHDLRAMINKPEVISDEDWPNFLEIRAERVRHLDERLSGPRRRRWQTRDDPAEFLIRILSGEDLSPAS